MIKESVWRLRNWIEDNERIVFLGGAGVSTESGIPDFRSEDGMFTPQNHYGRLPEELLHIHALQHDPEAFFSYYREHMIHPDAQPNDAHEALLRLEQLGKLSAIITQNVDGLHQLAGSQRVLELHGSIYDNLCCSCHKSYSLNAITGSASTVPHCPLCGGIIRPGVVLYGENLNPQVFEAARQAIAQADMLIIGGTSLAVYPAASLLQHYQGNHMALINKSDTAYDRRANLVIHDSVGKTLRDAVARVRITDEIDGLSP